MTSAPAVETVQDVGERARELELIPPDGAALLPRNFFTALGVSDLEYDGYPEEIVERLRRAGVPVRRLEPEGVEIFLLREKSGTTLLLPTLFLGASLWSHNPELVNVALGVVANYLTDFFKLPGVGHKRVKFSIVAGSTEVRYDGSSDGVAAFLRGVPKVIRETNK